MAQNINVEVARKILVDILKTLSLPENAKRINEAKCKYFLNSVVFLEVSACHELF